MNRWRVEKAANGQWIVITPGGAGFLLPTWRAAYSAARRLAEATS